MATENQRFISALLGTLVTEEPTMMQEKFGTHGMNEIADFINQHLTGTIMYYSNGRWHVDSTPPS